MSDNKENTFNLEQKLGKYFENPILILSSMGIIGIIVRLHYFPYNVPIILDGLAYFWYAIDARKIYIFGFS